MGSPCFTGRVCPRPDRGKGWRTPTASGRYLEQADTLAIVVPATTTDRGWPNHVPLAGPELTLEEPNFAMTEQPRAITRERLHDVAGTVDAATMAAMDAWLRDFLALP